MFNKILFVSIFCMLTGGWANASGCKFPSLRSLMYSITVNEESLSALQVELSVVTQKHSSLATDLKMQKQKASQLESDLILFGKLYDASQSEINRVYYTSKLLAELSEDCAECLTLDDLFEFVHDELPEEYWSKLEPLRDYLQNLDDFSESKYKRLEQALKTFSSELLIESLENDIAQLVLVTESKRQVLADTVQQAAQLQIGFENANSRLQSLRASITKTQSSLEGQRGAVKNSFTKEGMCSSDGSRML